MNVEQGWIEWNGGECPVEPRARVEVMLRNRRQMGPKFAKGVDWKHREAVPRFDVIAYRIVEPGK